MLELRLDQAALCTALCAIGILVAWAGSGPLSAFGLGRTFWMLLLTTGIARPGGRRLQSALCAVEGATQMNGR